MVDCNIRLLEHIIPCRFRFADTARYFQTDPNGPVPTDCLPVTVHPEAWQELSDAGIELCAHTEYSVLTAFISDALLPLGCVVFHAVALRWRGRAWLICAESGVGKSTQARWLRRLRPEEFGVISGDRPILSFQTNEITVHPSPWNGKENWHDAEAAPLGGLILLERGEENRLFSLTEHEAVLSVYPQFIYTAWDRENVKRVADLETRLLRAGPLWKLTTHEVPASTKLLLETVFKP